MKKLTKIFIVQVMLLCCIIYDSHAAGTWTKIGGPVGTVVEDSSHRLFATKLPEGDIYQIRMSYVNNQNVMKWEKIGNPGKMFVAVRNQLYALSSGGGVWWYTPTDNDPEHWNPIPLPPGVNKMGNIYGGPTGLFGTEAVSGDIYAYNNFLQGVLQKDWTKIGGPGKMFAVGGEKGEFAAAIHYLYGIEPDTAGNKVRQFDFKAKNWDNIIGPNPAVNIYAGGEKIYATNPSGNINEYNHQTKTWTKIGYPGKMFSVDKVTGTIYGLSTDGSQIRKYTGTPLTWIKIREAPTSSIHAGVGGHLFAIDAVTNDLWAYVDNPFTIP